MDPWHSGMNKLLKRKCVKTECQGKRQRDHGCSERGSPTEKTTLWVSGTGIALVCRHHSLPHTDGTSRGKCNWVHALWQPCSLLRIFCLQIPEYFTMFWKKNLWSAIWFLRCQDCLRLCSVSFKTFKILRFKSYEKVWHIQRLTLHMEEKNGIPRPLEYALHAAAHAVDLFCFTIWNRQLSSKVIQNKNTFTTCRPAQHTWVRMFNPI